MKERMVKGFMIKCLIFLLFLSIGMESNALAKFPEKRVTWICTYAVGGGTDAVFRVVAKHAEKALGVPIVVKNTTGGAGQVGWMEFKKSKPDGYTLSHENMPQTVLLPLARKAGFHYSDFEAINSFSTDNVAIAVKADSEWKTLDDFLTYAKDNPGIVTVGIGDYLQHHDLTAMLLEEKANVKLQRVALGGGGPQKVALLGGHVDVVCMNVSGAYRITESLRVLAVASEKKHPLFPDVPTLKEKGYDVVQGVERGFIALKGTPEDRLEFWREFFAGLFQKKALIEDLENAGLPVEYYDHNAVVKGWKKSEGEYRALLEKRGLLKK